MRTCLFTPNFLPAFGGAERMADAIVRGLLDRGHQVVVLAQQPAPGQREPNLPYTVRRYARPPAQHLWPERLATPLRKLHREFAFDAVLAFYAYPNGYAADHARAKLPGVKVVVSPRGGDLYPHFHALRKPRVKSVIARGYARADRIVAVSRWTANRIAEVTGRQPDQLPPIDHAPNGLDLAEFDQQLEASQNLAPLIDMPFLLQLSRLHDVKQHAVTLQALAKIKPELDAARMKLAIVGDGPEEPRLVKLADELGLQGYAFFLGRRTGAEKMWLLGHAHAMVAPSREEGMPSAVLEGLAAGLPVVASGIDPHREAIDDSDLPDAPTPHAAPPRASPGLFFPVGDTSKLADQLARVIREDNRPRVAAALERRKRYDLPVMLDAYDRALRAAVDA
ncbi:MAG: glycosyltransferase family 4 protein [Planctomycetota bacterium]